MIRVVLDTNVLVAGLRSRRGASAELLRRFGDGEFASVVTVPLVIEYEAAVAAKVDWMTVEDREDFLDGFCALAERRLIYFLWRPFLKDPGDDMVLEAAVESGVDCLVTHNTKDFAGTEESFGVRVLTPQAFLGELRRAR